MRILTHTVAAGEDGLTVRQLLRSLWHIDHSLLSRLKFRNAITLNGTPVTVRAVAHTGDLLCADVSDPPGENPHIQPVDFPLDVLYEDDDLLLLNKPAGIALHPAALTEEPVTLAGAVAFYLRSDTFHAVNRLDRGTTGHHGRGQNRALSTPAAWPSSTPRTFSGTTGLCARAYLSLRRGTSTCPWAGRRGHCSGGSPTRQGRPHTPIIRCWRRPRAAPCCG